VADPFTISRRMHAYTKKAKRMAAACEKPCRHERSHLIDGIVGDAMWVACPDCLRRAPVAFKHDMSKGSADVCKLLYHRVGEFMGDARAGGAVIDRWRVARGQSMKLSAAQLAEVEPLPRRYW
jgi:hypothetical protein